MQGISELEIRHAAVLSHLTVDEKKAFRQQLLEIIMQTICQIAVIPDVKSYFDRIGGDELGFGRALDFTDVSTCVENILGDRPKFRLSDWKADASGTSFPPQRKLPWDDGLKERSSERDTTPIMTKPGTGEPPAELLDVESLKHRDRRVFSFINIPLWNKAGWQGTAYGCRPDSNMPPILAPGFRDAEAAQAIFKEWRARLGEVDTDEQLRVSIITGVDKTHPSSYTVVIGVNPKMEHNIQIITTMRMNHMTPTDSSNLDNFLRQFERTQRYILMPAHFTEASVPPKFFLDLGIEKRQIRVCPAWQLGENDFDICAISPDDDPIIPKDIKEPPVLRAMQKIRDRQAPKGLMK
jgi:hypothetical protein